VSLVLVFIVSIVIHKSSPLYSLDFSVLTLNQVCGVKFKFYRITYSPPSRCSQQEKPRVAGPTELRDSYASGIRVPHSSPSHEATHTWLSGSVSRQASPSARNEEKYGITPKIPTCSGPNSHNEQTPALKVPLQTELRFHSHRYEQPPYWRACGATKPLVARRRPLR
jgi:hypothetical protein